MIAALLVECAQDAPVSLDSAVGPGRSWRLAASAQLKAYLAEQDVRVIVPFAHGAPPISSRARLFEHVSTKVGQSFIVENRPGGAAPWGDVPSPSRARRPTVLVHSNALVTAPRSSYALRSVQDFAGITPARQRPMVLVISTDKKFTTLKDLVAAAKAKPASASYFTHAAPRAYSATPAAPDEWQRFRAMEPHRGSRASWFACRGRAHAQALTEKSLAGPVCGGNSNFCPIPRPRRLAVCVQRERQVCWRAGTVLLDMHSARPTLATAGACRPRSRGTASPPLFPPRFRFLIFWIGMNGWPKKTNCPARLVARIHPG
jgi:hypothetical protein